MVQRDGDLSLFVTKNVKTNTVQPLIESTVSFGSKIYTDEYAIYNFLPNHYQHCTVYHSKKEYAIDLDGDGVNETHCNTQEGIWSLLRPWLKKARGIHKNHLLLHVAPCEFFYNRRKDTPSKQFRSLLKLGVQEVGNLARSMTQQKILKYICPVEFQNM